MYINLLGKIRHPKKLIGITLKNTETQKMPGFSPRAGMHLPGSPELYLTLYSLVWIVIQKPYRKTQ